MTVDVEDYFHVSAFAHSIKRESWASQQSRVRNNNHRLLQLFSDSNVRATFFVLGWAAEQEPRLVPEIVAAGHEVACHGFSHRLIYEQGEAAFRQETDRAKKLLEDQSGCAVLGYRAASFSITNRSRWALEVLADIGFQYDSSVVPVRHDLYGIPSGVSKPHRLLLTSGNSIMEFPPATLKIAGVNLPIGGGGYFRLYPYTFTKWALRKFNEAEGSPFAFYVHPWELDPDQPRIITNWKSRFRHYNNLAITESRLRKLLGDFRLTAMGDVLKECPLDTFSFSTDATLSTEPVVNKLRDSGERAN